MRKSVGFTAVAIATLAVGIGANAAIFSIVNGVLLRPLRFPEADRIVSVWTATPNEPRNSHSAGDFMDIQRENQSLAAIAGYRSALVAATPPSGQSAQLEGVYATIDFFDVLGTAAAEGRTFSRAADASSRERLVVLSHAARQPLFGEAPAAGQHLRIDDQSHLVIGVMPPLASWPESGKLWILSPKDVPPSPLDVRDGDRDVRYFNAIARLKPGISVQQAQDDLDRVASLLQGRTASSEPRSIRIAPLRDEVIREVRRALLVLQGAVSVVLLIACANVSSLLIARGAGRRRELAIRTALGAGRARLVRQLLAESVMLGVAGGCTGLLLGAHLTSLLVRFLPESVPRAGEVEMNVTVSIVMLGTALAAAVLFGVVPALQASRTDASTALKAGGDRASTARARARALLVVAEVALTLVLLAAAGLLVNSFVRLQRVDSGFDPDGVVVASVALPQSRYASGASQVAVYGRLLDALAARPEFVATGIGFPGPLRGDNASGSFFIEGRAASPDTRPFAHIGLVSGGFFAALGIPIAAGRTFTEADTAGAPAVAIVSETLARHYWPGVDPIGKRLKFDDDPKVPWMTVVGVSGDARQLGLHEPPPPLLYIPYQQFPLPFTTVALRSRAGEDAAVSALRTDLRRIDTELALGAVAPLRTVLDRAVEEPRFRTFVLATFATIALVLAAVGIYGLISYSVAQRTREIGIRVALGARPHQILGGILGESLLVACVGVGVGVAAAAVGVRALSKFLFGIPATHVPTFAAVAAILLVVAVIASYVPSRRAMRVDPIAALRSE